MLSTLVQQQQQQIIDLADCAGMDEHLSPEALSLRIGLLAQARLAPLYDVRSRFYLALDGAEIDVTLKAEGSLAVINPVVPPTVSGKDMKKASMKHGGPTDFALDPFTEDGRLVPEICLLVELETADKLSRAGGGADYLQPLPFS